MSEDYSIDDIKTITKMYDKYYNKYRKISGNKTMSYRQETLRDFEIISNLFDYILTIYLNRSSRKGIIYSNKEKAYVTRQPLWWIPLGGRSKC